MIRIARFVVAPVIAVVVIAVIVFGGCEFGDNTFTPPDGQLGPRDDIGACCDEWRPWDTDAPGECLDDLCEPGVCRWLDCLAGIYSYHSEACP